MSITQEELILLLIYYCILLLNKPFLWHVHTTAVSYRDICSLTQTNIVQEDVEGVLLCCNTIYRITQQDLSLL